MIEFLEFAKACAPEVHPSTLVAVVRHESRFDPLVINVNGKPGRVIRSKTREQAIKEARTLLASGASFDAGYGQINSKNWEWLGITPESAFDPCTNLRAAQRVLVDCYQRASKSRQGDAALYAAFSCYNTGNFTYGFSNGYVQKVIAAGGVKVPALPSAAVNADNTPSALIPPATPSTTKSPASKDAFEPRRQDAFSEPRADAFAQPSSARMSVGSIIYHPRTTQ